MGPAPKVPEVVKRFVLKPDVMPLFGFLSLPDSEGCNNMGLSVKATTPFVSPLVRLTMWRKGCANGRLDVISQLVNLGDNLMNDTLATKAAPVNGQVAILSFLLMKKRASLPALAINEGNRWGWAVDHCFDYRPSTLPDVTKNGHLSVLLILRARCFNFHIQGDATLHYAAYYGQVDIILFLLTQDLDVCSKDNRALSCAVSQGHQPAFKVLLDNGAQATGNDCVGHGILHEMCDDRPDILRLLLDACLPADRKALTNGSNAITWSVSNYILEDIGANIQVHLDVLLSTARGRSHVMKYLLEEYVVDRSKLLPPLKDAITKKEYHKVEACMVHGFTPAILGFSHQNTSRLSSSPLTLRRPRRWPNTAGICQCQCNQQWPRDGDPSPGESGYILQLDAQRFTVSRPAPTRAHCELSALV